MNKSNPDFHKTFVDQINRMISVRKRSIQYDFREIRYIPKWTNEK